MKIGLAVTGITINSAAELVLLRQFCSQIAQQLPGFGVVEGHEFLQRLGFKHERPRPDVLFWITMTIQTPLHRQRLIAPDKSHFADPTVTLIATDTFVNMNTVIEVNVIRQVVNTIPMQWLVIPQARSNRS